MSHYVYRNLQATEITKLQLIVALYVVYIWPDIWNSQVHIAYSLYNFYEATMTIKGRL